MKPIYIHSGMAGAPQYANADGNINAILEACLVDGFNTKTATSASASGGVLTLNFGTDPGFEALQTVELAVSSVALVNGVHRVVANSNNQVTIAIAGLPDGAVGSSGAGITIKQAGAGWSKPFSSATKAVFRPPAGSRRYFRLEHMFNDNVKARGYEDMTDVDTGAGPFPTLAQEVNPVGIYNMSYGAASGALWICVATDKWLIFSIANVNYFIGTLFFGDLAAPVVPGDAYATMTSTINSKYLCRNYEGAPGASVAAQRDSDGATAVWPSVIAGGARFIPYVPVTENSILRGFLPNAYKLMPHASSANFLDIYSNVGGTPSRMRPFSSSPANTLNFAIAIDEEAWT